MTISTRKAKREKKRHAGSVIFSSAFGSKADLEESLAELDHPVDPAFDHLFNAALVSLVLNATEEVDRKTGALPSCGESVGLVELQSELPIPVCLLYS